MSTHAPALPHRLSDSRLAALVGGWRGAVDGALPPLVFVATNAAAGARLPDPTALAWALAAAATVGVALTVVRVLRRESLRQAVRGLVGLGVAAGFASASGDARDFFRPGIWVDAVWAVALAASAFSSWPAIGVVHQWLFRTGRQWRADLRLRRVFALLTLAWAAVYAVRAGVGAVLYGAHEAGLLALAKIGLGWPLTIVAALLTLAALRRVGGGATAPGAPPAR